MEQTNSKDIKEKKQTMDYSTLIEFMNRKDISNYTHQELQLLTDLFKTNGYDINLLKLSKLKNCDKV
jgi:hypothetical protein